MVHLPHLAQKINHLGNILFCGKANGHNHVSFIGCWKIVNIGMFRRAGSRPTNAAIKTNFHCCFLIIIHPWGNFVKHQLALGRIFWYSDFIPNLKDG